MDLVAVENTRITYLLQVFRAAGISYQPELVQKLIQRYSFVKFPSLEELLKNERIFRVGKFRDIQITDFGIYSDGIIVASAADSNILDEFIDDLVNWARDELGVVYAAGTKQEKSYESFLVVKSSADLLNAFAPSKDALAAINRAFNTDRYVGGPLDITGVIAGLDETSFEGTKKPLKFILDRRSGVAFGEGVFYSQAPLRTQDHLDVLRALERIALGR